MLFMPPMTSVSVSLSSRDTPVTFTGLQRENLQEAGTQFCSMQLSGQCRLKFLKSDAEQFILGECKHATVR